MIDRFFVSVDGVRWVLLYSKSKGPSRIVLIVLAALVDQECCAWPAIETLCDAANMARASVFQALADLEEIKEIQIERTSGKKNVYFLPRLKEWLDNLPVHTSSNRTDTSSEESGEKNGFELLDSEVTENKEQKTATSSHQFNTSSTPVQNEKLSDRKEASYKDDFGEKSKRVIDIDNELNSATVEERSKPSSYKEVFKLASSIFRQATKLKFGTLWEKHEGRWKGLIEEYGQETVLGAVKLWASELDKEWARKQTGKMNWIAVFLKDADDRIQDFKDYEAPEPKDDKKPEVEDDEVTIEDIRRERGQDRRGKKG